LFADSDNTSVAESLLAESVVDADIEWKNKIDNYLKGRRDEERTYIKEMLPHLIDSIKEATTMYTPSINQTFFESIIQNLIYGKEMVISIENKCLSKLVEKEMYELQNYRPREMIDEDDLFERKRKNKKATKGNKNHSAMNHMNENYVSNIFQFSKQNYPNDKEIQKIANTRNVSASNFKKLTKMNLKDGVMIRKAKVRILSSGKELVNNVEFWMNDGYFDQCTDREKYIHHKGKALTDLVLERFH